MVAAAAAAAVTAARFPVLVVRDRVLEVAAAGGSYAGGLGALPVPDLDQVAEQGAGPVPGRLVPVIAVVDRDRDRDEGDGVVPAAGVQVPGSDRAALSSDQRATSQAGHSDSRR